MPVKGAFKRIIYAYSIIIACSKPTAAEFNVFAKAIISAALKGCNERFNRSYVVVAGHNGFGYEQCGNRIFEFFSVVFENEFKFFVSVIFYAEIRNGESCFTVDYLNAFESAYRLVADFYKRYRSVAVKVFGKVDFDGF